MDLKFELKSNISNNNSKMIENYSYLNSSVSEENSLYLLQQKNFALEYQLKKKCLENEQLKKNNKILSNKIEFLVNNNTVVKNVKNDMNDCSQISHFQNQDSLREFFYLLVISEKMHYLNYDEIWKIDSNLLYKEVLEMDLNFYEWQGFIKIKIQNEIKALELGNLNGCKGLKGSNGSKGLKGDYDSNNINRGCWDKLRYNFFYF